MSNKWLILGVSPLLLVSLLLSSCTCTCSSDESGIGGDWNPDGLMAYLSGGEIYVRAYNGSNPTRITNIEEIGGVSVWSPDGTKVAFVFRPDENTEELYVVNEDSSGLIKLSKQFDIASGPSWSSDNSQITFHAKQGEDWDIYSIDVDGSDLIRLTNDSEVDIHPAWSPNTNKIAFISVRDGSRELYIMDSDGSNQVRLTTQEKHAGAPAWSPSGDKIAFFYGGEIHTVDPNGSSLAKLTSLNKRSGFINPPAWSVDGSEISFTYVDYLSSSMPQETIYYWINADGTNLVRSK